LERLFEADIGDVGISGEAVRLLLLLLLCRGSGGQPLLASGDVDPEEGQISWPLCDDSGMGDVPR
jgi:hypothetical protein